mmetsp:Transcript_21506/g.46622  ORF Transcript_21506/g.46622 Transcript_21506/m.46622 type:complete len:270 (-) Transcript_21506:172-981(-)
MSAYALPGLFPPLPSYSTRKEVVESSFSLSSSTTTAKEVGPAEAALQESREDESSRLHNNKDSSSSSERVGIAVKEGKIDSAMLVQSMANPGVDVHNHNSPRSRRRLRNRSSGSTPAHQESNNTQEEEAIQFELSVSLGGRKYTAVRSWPSICQLRNDLIRSLPPDDKIPELPRLHEPGVLARSFSFLHQLVKSYAPTLEGWLKTVADLVPHDNPILSHFLYEAVHDENKWNPALVKELDQRACDTLLDAIDETECDDEEEEDDADLVG